MRKRLIALIIGILLLNLATTCAFCSCQSTEEPAPSAPVDTGPNFSQIYSDLGRPSYCKLASDGSYLSIDTNPSNIDDYTNYSAYQDIPEILNALGLPDYLFEEMKQTRALDGRQNSDFDNVNVSWSYHPDQGLEVVFKKKF